MTEKTRLADLQGTAGEAFSAVMGYLPQVLAALALLLAGWLAATALRALARRAQAGLERLLPPPLRRRVVARGLSARLLPGLVYWLVWLAFIAAAAQVLDLQLFSEWLNALLRYLPLLLAGLLVVFVGFLLSQLSRDLIAATLTSAGVQYPVLLGYAGQALVLLLATIIGMDLIGLETGFLTMLAGIATGAVGGGIALSFGLGAQLEVSNRLAARALKGRYRPGDRIRIGDYEGTILDLTPLSLVVETDSGRVDLPARLFSEQPCVLLMPETEDD